MLACPGLVHGIKCLVGEGAVGDVTFGIADASLYGLGGIGHVVVSLVMWFQVVEYL